MILEPIERRSGLTKREFEETYLNEMRPVVFTDLAQDWPATKKWTFDFLRSKYGHIEVPLYDNSYSQPGEGYMSVKKTMKFGDYLTIIENEPTELRMFLFNIFKHAPELVDDIKPLGSWTASSMSIPLCSSEARAPR